MSEKTKLLNTVRNVDDAIEYLGFGRFTFTIIFTVGMFYMGEAVELNLMSILTPQLRCDWNLTSLEASMLSSMTYFGLFLGNVYWGYLSDVHGRRIILIASSCLTVFFGLLSAASHGFYMFVVMRFMVGFGLGAAIHVMCYIGEFVPKRHRGKSIVGSEMFYAFGSIYVVVSAMLMINSIKWKAYLLFMCIPPFIFLLMSFWLPESIHFLQNTNRYDELTKTLHRVSRMNNITIPALELDTFGETQQQRRGDIKILLRHEYRWKFVAMLFPFMAGMGGYFGLILLNTEILSTTGFCGNNGLNTTINTTHHCHKLDNDDYRQSIFVVLAELPGIFIPALTVDFIGRKPYLMVSFLLTGVGMLCLNFCLSDLTGVVLMFVLRCLATGTSQVILVIAIEIFPTLIRTTAYGLLVGSSRFFLIFVPFIVVSLYDVSKLAATGLFAGISFIAVFSLLFVEETNNKSLRNS